MSTDPEKDESILHQSVESLMTQIVALRAEKAHLEFCVGEAECDARTAIIDRNSAMASASEYRRERDVLRLDVAHQRGLTDLSVSSVNRAVDRAIRTEREACAQVAQHHTDCGLARDIAAAIRARTK